MSDSDIIEEVLPIHRETEGTWMFKTPGQLRDSVMGSLYVRKSALKNKGKPTKVIIVAEVFYE